MRKETETAWRGYFPCNSPPPRARSCPCSIQRQEWQSDLFSYLGRATLYLPKSCIDEIILQKTTDLRTDGPSSQHRGLAAARLRFEESLVLARAVGDKILVAWALDGMAMVAIAQGEYARARQLVEECLALFR